MKPIFLIGLAALWLAGCAPADKKETPPAQPPAQSNAAPQEKSVTRQAVEGFTGKTSVDAGQRTKAKIKAIEKQRQENFEGIPP
jgi:PBP1b-binding outer membrane lipoprotein LpoB